VTVRVALVSAVEALALDEDLPPLVAAMQQMGVTVETPCWDDPAVDWPGYDVAVLRSTWDYAERVDELVDWAQRCGQATRLLNPVAIVRWNTDKHYLQHLQRHGVPVVPTRYVEPGSDPDAALQQFLSGSGDWLSVGEPCGFKEFVIKPSIGAGSRDAARYRRGDAIAAAEHLRRLVVAQGRSTMLQPYLERVDDYGETAVVYFGGAFSHAVRKGPLLKLGQGLVTGLFAPEEITARRADAAELEVAAKAHAAIPHAAPLYARIDLIRDAEGRPVVLELELTEPSLFFNHAAGAAERLADLVLEQIRRE